MATETPQETPKATPEKAPKLKWNQYANEDDITFRGPLSYRHFKIIGWLLLVVKLIIPPIKLATMADPGLEGMLAGPLALMEFLAPLSVFFLLMASFSQLLIKRDYKRQLIFYGGAALAIIVAFNFLYHRYLVGAVDAFVGNRDETLVMCDVIFSALNPVGYITFNVFLDLFLCACVMFFLNYEPTKFFVGDRLKWFRAGALLPVIFEIVCLWLKVQANRGGFHMPISFFPFLPTKPPMMFFVICAMIVYHAVLERQFCKDGRTHEEYLAYLQTNRSRWRFAKFAAIACAVAAVADVGFAYYAIADDPEGGVEVIVALWQEPNAVGAFDIINKYFNAGFGGSVDLLVFAPIMLLFDYTRTYDDTSAESAIPVLAITLLVFLYLEGGLFAMGAVAGIVKEQLVPALNQMVVGLERAYGNMSEEDLMLLLGAEGTSSEVPASDSTSQVAAA